MKKCWKLSPSERPCFRELVVSLDKMLMSVADYIELSMTLVETGDEEEWMQYEEVDDMAMMGEFRSVFYALMVLSHCLVSADEKNGMVPNPCCGGED